MEILTRGTGQEGQQSVRIPVTSLTYLRLNRGRKIFIHYSIPYVSSSALVFVVLYFFHITCKSPSLTHQFCKVEPQMDKRAGI